MVPKADTAAAQGKRRLFCIFAFVLTLWGCTQRPVVQEAREGRLDLAPWRFATQGTVLLDGQWNFYWNRLLTPADFRSDPAPAQTGTLVLSRLWRDETPHQDLKGTATLRLTLDLGPDRGLMGIELAAMTAAYRLWLDEKLLAEQGRVGDSRASERPSFGRKVVLFQPTAEPFTLTLQLSSHNMLGGNLPSPRLLLGTRDQLFEKAGRERRTATVLLAIFLLMAGYHLLLFLFYRRDLSTLYFALYCVCWLVNTGAGYAATWLMPDIEPLVSARLIYSLDLFSYHLSVPVITLFFRAMFPEEVPQRLPRLILAAAALFISGILLAQAAGLSPLETGLPQYYHLVTLFCVGWSALCLTQAMKKRRSGAGLILTGFTVLTLAGTNDILHDLHLIHTGFFMPMGILLFIIFQSFALAQRFSHAFAVAETLSRELTDKNIALARMDRLKDEFLANTSHELRTPLSGIIGISESLLAGSAGQLSPEARHNLELVAGSGRRLTGLINDILDFTRLRNRDMPLEFKAVDARAVTGVVLTLLAPLAREKQLELVNEIPRDLSPVRADEDRFQQILYNLLGNAVKFSDQGRITVSARTDGQMAAISVSDQGMGVPQAQHRAIFEPFQQADASARRSRHGLGLGLAIAENLVRLHGGDLSLDSTPGKGSTFTFTLPVSHAPAASPHRESSDLDSQHQTVSAPAVLMPAEPPRTGSPPAGPQGGAAPRILVVDDDPVNLQVLVNHLHLEGFAVDAAANGALALKQVEKALPDLVLLDIMMPEMTGYEVCESLRQTYSASRLPVVMLTAKTRVRDIVQGFACGASDYLAKPFEKGELLARVRTQLQLKQAYETMAENIRLKKELARRRQTELDLRLNQHRLAQLLDAVDDMVVTINESREISFCNQAAADVLGYDSDALLGKPLDLLLETDWVRTLEKPLQQTDTRTNGSPPDCWRLDIRTADGRMTRVDMSVTVLTVDDEQMQALILRRTTSRNASGLSGSRETLALIDEINRHQERLRGLENSLNGLFPQLRNLAPGLEQEVRSLDQALDGIQNNLISPLPAGRRELGVLVMQLSLDYWYEAADQDKAALAVESGIWKTYTDRHGYTRTQTLDKYFSEATLPSQPRWKWISQTAVYVLAACTTPSSLRDRLETALDRFRSGG